MKKQLFYVVLTLALIVLGVFAPLGAMPDEAGAQYSTNCYMEQGGSKFVAGSGCEIEVQSGATFDLQSGATTDFSSGMDLDAAALVFDADGDTQMIASTDDLIAVTVNSATGLFNILTGNVKIGNGTNDQTLSGEDLYVEGTLEVDGGVYLDGNISDNGGAVTVADNAAITGQADAVQLTVTGYTTQTNDLVALNGGLVDIGGGTYGTADGDNDLGVDGDIEANGNIVFGTDGLYPLGYAGANQQIVCGTTEFTDSTTIDVTALTTATYVIASQVTAPAATGTYLYVSDPTTTTVTLTSLESDFSAGTTGVTVHYCVVGDQ